VDTGLLRGRLGDDGVDPPSTPAHRGLTPGETAWRPCAVRLRWVGGRPGGRGLPAEGRLARHRRGNEPEPGRGSRHRRHHLPQRLTYDIGWNEMP